MLDNLAPHYLTGDNFQAEFIRRMIVILNKYRMMEL